MAINRKHQINVHTSTGTTAPTGASLYLGEIAVQHTPDNPALWIKMGTSESSNVYEKFIGQTEINTLIQNGNILGSGYTYSGLPYVNSSTTVADAYSALTNEMFKNEQVTAAAFNDLNDKIEELSAMTEDSDAITSITLNNTEYTGTSVNLGTVVTAQTQLSTASTGTGNVISNLTVSDHQITMNKNFSAASASQLITLSGAAHNKITALSAATTGINSTLNTHTGNTDIHVTTAQTQAWDNKQDTITDLAAIRNGANSGASAYTGYIAHSANTDIHVTSADKTKWTNGANSGGSAYTMVLDLSGATLSAITATGDNYINASVANRKDISVGTKNAVVADKTTLAGVSATGSLVDALAVKGYVDDTVSSSVSYKGATATLPASSTVGDMYIATAQIALTAGQSATGVAQTAETGDFIIARESGKWDVIQKNLDGAVTGNLTADTVTLGNGTHTVKSLANGTQGQVLTMGSSAPEWSSITISDTATTETGHYAPSTTSSTEGSTTGFIQQIKLDSKKHVVGIVSGTTSFTETSISVTNGTAGNSAAAVVTGITTGGTAGHSLTLNRSNKVFSATTSDSALTSNSAVTSTSAKTSVSATTSNSAVTATNATKVNNHEVNVDVPAGALFTDSATTLEGHYTPSTTSTTEGSTTGFIQQIKLDEKKHVVGIVSGTVTVTDTATTEAGHYTPSTSASTKGTTAATANYIKGIRIDSKNHVIDVATGTVVTAQTSVTTASTGTGNVVTSLTTGGTDGHKITMVKDFSAATAAQLLALSASVETNKTNITNLSAATTGLSASVITLSGIVEDNELVVAQALNVLNNKIEEISGNTGGGSSEFIAVTAVTINGAGNVLSTATYSDKTLTITKGNLTSSDTATTYQGHYTPTGQSPTQVTNYINALTFDGKGHIVSVGVSTPSDSATTQEGHYSPVTPIQNAGGNIANTALKSVAFDSKGHYISAETISVITSIPTAATVVNDSSTIPTNAAVYTALQDKLGTAETAADSNKLAGSAATTYAQTGGTYNSLTAGKTVSALTINYKNGDGSTGSAIYNGSANTTVNISGLSVCSVSAFNASMTDQNVIYAVTGSNRNGVYYINGSGGGNISIPGDQKDIVCVSGISNNVQITSITGNMLDGQSVHVVFATTSSSTNYSITIPSTGGNYVNMTGSQTITTVNGYAEMNVLFVNNKYLIRAV